MNGEIKKRYTAYKFSISQLAQGKLEFEKDPNDPSRENFKFLAFANKEVNRVNVIANVIDKYQQERYATLTLDDGTGTIRVKAFSDSLPLLESIKLGDTILALGTLRYFNNEIYILPNIIKQLDARWLLVRKLELEKEYGKIYQEKTQNQLKQLPSTEEAKVEEEEVEEEKIGENKEEPSLREKIFDAINGAEAEEGIDIDKMIMQLTESVDEINKTVTELLEEGTIFEPRPGRLRIL